MEKFSQGQDTMHTQSYMYTHIQYSKQGWLIIRTPLGYLNQGPWNKGWTIFGYGFFNSFKDRNFRTPPSHPKFFYNNSFQHFVRNHPPIDLNAFLERIENSVRKNGPPLRQLVGSSTQITL